MNISTIRLVALLLATLPAGLLITAQTKSSKSRLKKSPQTQTARTPSSPIADEPGPSVEGIRANNVGVALMDEHKFTDAVARFQTACIMVPDSDIGCLNAGIALVAMQQYDEARKLLTTSVARDPQNARAWFNLGLLNRAQNYNDLALQDFQKVAALDAADASTQCLIGFTYENHQNYSAAINAFQAALKIDPVSVAAESGLADAFARSGDAAAQQTHLDRANHLASLGVGRPIGDAYGEQGKYSLAAEIPSPGIVPPMEAVHFVDVTQSSGLAPIVRKVAARGRSPHSRVAAKPAAEPPIRTMADFLGSGACVFDYDGDGRPDIFLVNADGKGDAALYHNLGQGHFADATKSAKIDFHGEGMACAVGDYDNDGLPDLAISFNGGIRLFHNDGKGRFTDVTGASGIRADGLVMGVSFVDCDRDGNLDLYATRFHDFPLEHPSQPFNWPQDNPPGNMLWHNNGDGTFSNATASLGVAGDASSTALIASDFTNSGMLDFLLAGLSPTPKLLLGQPEGAFKSTQPWGAETQGPTAGGVAFDFDKDGYMDVALTHWQPGTLGLWRNVGGKGFQHVALPDPGWMRAWGIFPVDFDNDGWMDLIAVGETFSGEGRITLLRNEGEKGFHDVTAQTGLDKIVLHDPRSVVAFDPEGNGSTYFLVTQNRREAVLLKEISAVKQPNWAKIVLLPRKAEAPDITLFPGKGKAPDTTLLPGKAEAPGTTLLTGKAGAAVAATAGGPIRVETFSGALRQTWEIPGTEGYLSRGPATITVGLGDQYQIDAVRIFWNAAGPPQIVMAVPAGKQTSIAQQDAASNP